MWGLVLVAVAPEGEELEEVLGRLEKDDPLPDAAKMRGVEGTTQACATLIPRNKEASVEAAQEEATGYLIGQETVIKKNRFGTE